MPTDAHGASTDLRTVSSATLAGLGWHACLSIWRWYLTAILCLIGALLTAPFAWAAGGDARLTFGLQLHDLIERISTNHKRALTLQRAVMSEHRRRKGERIR